MNPGIGSINKVKTFFVKMLQFVFVIDGGFMHQVRNILTS